jgi:hypothetical protein
LSKLDDFSGEDLVRMWRDSGLSQRAFARKNDWNFNAMHGKIHRAQQEVKEDRIPSEDGRIKDETDGNHRTVTSISDDIVRPEQLIELAAIDETVWNIFHRRVNVWQGGRKHTTKDLTFTNGRIEGFTQDDGEWNKTNFFQVELKMVRHQPVALKPVISPVRFKEPAITIARPHKAQYGQTLSIADPHFGFKWDLRRRRLIPFHDRRALSVILSLAQERKFDKIVIKGDWLDNANFSTKFARSPDMFLTTQPAVIEGGWFLWQLRKLQPDAEIEFLAGNHDQRMLDYLVKHMYEAFQLKPAFDLDGHSVMHPANLMGFEQLGITYVDDYPDGEIWITDDTRAIHGIKVRAKPGHTAAAILEDAVVNTQFGHVHRIEKATKRHRDRFGSYTVTAMCSGCLCRVDGTVPGSSPDSNWQQGFDITIYDHLGAHGQMFDFEIADGRAYCEGKTYESFDYVDQLSDEMDYEF